MENNKLYYEYIKDNVSEFESFLFEKLKIERFKEHANNLINCIQSPVLKQKVQELSHNISKIILHSDISVLYNKWSSNTIKEYTNKYLSNMNAINAIKATFKDNNIETYQPKIIAKMNDNFKKERNNFSLVCEGILTINRDKQNKLKIESLVTAQQTKEYINDLEMLLLLYNIVSFISLSNENKISVKYTQEDSYKNIIMILNKLHVSKEDSLWEEAINLITDIFVSISYQIGKEEIINGR